MEEWPDLDWQKNKEQFDVAYSARRDAISVMTNIAKISPWYVDASVGHRIPETGEEFKKKLTRDDDNRKLAAQMERVIYDPKYSAHPAYCPLKIAEHATASSGPYSRSSENFGSGSFGRTTESATSTEKWRTSQSRISYSTV